MSVHRWQWFPITAAAFAVLLLALPVDVCAEPDFSVQKSVDNPVFGLPGPDLRQFTVTVTNNDGISHAAQVVDRLPQGLAIPAGLFPTADSGTYDAGTGIWSVGEVGPGASATLLIPVIADGSTRGCITNVASVSFSDPGVVDVNPANNESALTVAVPDCSQLVTSTYAYSEYIGVFGEAWYATVSVEVLNEGPSAARTVVVSGTISGPTFRDMTIRLSSGSCQSNNPLQLRCEFPEIAVGTQEIVEFRFNDPVDGTFRWDFAVDHAGADPDLSNNASSGTFAFRRDEAVDIAESGGCFIATAAYGSPLEPELAVLREFRDRYLMKHEVGRRLVSFYYRTAPALAPYVAKHAWLRAAIRTALEPHVIVMQHAGLGSEALPT